MVKKGFTKKSPKGQDIISLFIGILILLLLNYVSSRFYFRLDLTSEKRYTLSNSTKSLIENLDDIVFFKVYLEGDFPAGFKRLKNETREMLQEFMAYSNGNNIAFEFINPSESPDEQVRNAIYKELYQQGLRPTDLEIKDEDGISKKLVWPGAIVTYQGKEIPVDLLQSQMGLNSEDLLNSSIENLEYALSNAIRKLSIDKKEKIAFIEGHGELDEQQTADIALALSEYYAVDRVALDGKINALTSRNEVAEDSGLLDIRNNYKAIIVAKPQSAFTEKDKFLIDQFVMYGGSVLWLVDPILADMDSLTKKDLTMGISSNLNLEDMFFEYGVRLNPNLIQDIQSAPIPLPVGMVGNQPRYELFPWFFFPVMTSKTNHPIVNNLNAVKGEFVSTIDFVGQNDLTQTVLLSSSEYTKIVNAPVRISLGITRIEPKQEQFNKKHSPVAVLLEGPLRSLFDGRLTTQFQDSKQIQFKNESPASKMIFVADGDIIKNHVRGDGRILPLGVDKYTGEQYGNRDFILNAVNYLCDDSGMMDVRSRTLKIRLLDTTKINQTKLYWQILNMALPIGLLLLLGIFISIWRKRKYTKE